MSVGGGDKAGAVQFFLTRFFTAHFLYFLNIFAKNSSPDRP
jgi:hypothetical protein